MLYLNEKGRELFRIEAGANLDNSNIATILTSKEQLMLFDAVARDGKERLIQISVEGGAGEEPHTLVCRTARVHGEGGIASWMTFAAVEEQDGQPPEDDLTNNSHLKQTRNLAGLATWKMQVEDSQDWTSNAVKWDAEMYTLLNVPPDSLAATPDNFLNFVVPEDRGAILSAMRSHLADGSPYEVVFRLKPRNGPVKVMLSRGMSIEEPGARAVLGTVQDITPVNSARPQLFEKAALLDALAAGVEAPVYAVDDQFRCVYFNQFVEHAIRHLYGMKPVLGEKIYQFVLSDPRRRTIIRNLRRARDGFRVVETVPLVLTDSIVHQYELNYSPIVEGSVTSGVAVFGTRIRTDRGRSR
jgi:PAS domain-containing protein